MLVEIIDSFRQKIVERNAREFFAAETATSLGRLDMEVKERLSTCFKVCYYFVVFCHSILQDFYMTIIDYIDKWFRVEFLPTHISWIMLKTKSIDYDEALELAKQVKPEIAENDELFNEVVEVNRMLRQIPHGVFEMGSAETKWQKIFMVSKNFEMGFITYSLGQRFASTPLPTRKRYPFHSIGQHVRRAGLLFVQGAVDRREKSPSGGNGQGSSSSAGQLRH